MWNDLDGTFVGTLAGLSGSPLANDGLWALQFGNGGNVNSLYIIAGLNGEADGLFARVDAVPEPGSFFLLVASGSMLLLYARFRKTSD